MKLRRSVDDAGNPFDAVRGETFAQRLDDRDAAGHGAFERHHHALLVRSGEDLGAVHREQRLVCGDDVLAGLDRVHHQHARDAIAADQLDDDVDLGMRDHLAAIGHDLHLVADDAAGALGVQVGNHRDLDAATGAPADLFLISPQHVERAAAHGADAEQADLDGFHHDASVISVSDACDSDPENARCGRSRRSDRRSSAGTRRESDRVRPS